MYGTEWAAVEPFEINSKMLSENHVMGIRNYICLILNVVPALMFAAGVFAEDPNPACLHSDRGAWPLYRQWNTAETHHFAEWIGRIYDRKANGTVSQRLAKLEQVLSDPDMNLLLDPAFAGDPCNPQVDPESIRAMHRVVDCHKLSMSLGAYYACRRGLPFMFSQVRAVGGGDTRTADATYPVGAVSSFNYASPLQFFTDATVGTCTGNLRVPPFEKNSELSDTCPLALDRKYLLPGSLYYLDGHVLILAKMESSGNVRFLDATTSYTRDLYTFNSMNVVTGITPRHSENTENPYAGCFCGFRVFRYPIAETDENGKVTRVRRRTDAEMAEFGFSTEQYEKMEELVKQGKIMEDGLSFGSMHQLIRYRLRGSEPISLSGLLREYAARARAALIARDAAVQEAWAEVRANGPIEFPDKGADWNIYTAGGRWGRYTTALTDTEFRAAYFDFLEEVDAAIQWLDMQCGHLDLRDLNFNAIWSTSDLAWAFLSEKDRVFRETAFEITDSAGGKINMTLADLEKRLYDLSFDPNHPPELRWGVHPGSGEATGLPESPTPLRGGKTAPMADAYTREAYYRSLSQREIGETPYADQPLTGFPVRQIINEYLWIKWRGNPTPPLAPHGGRAAYEALYAKKQPAKK